MAHTYTLNLVHCVFSTKGRLPIMHNPALVWETLRAVAKNSQINVLAVGGTSNHVHILLDMPKTCALADVIRDLKANSSARIQRSVAAFAWQDGYGAISVSPSGVDAVVSYIEHQDEHHRSRSFEREYVAILEKSGVPYDSKYVFD
jgi:REP element-mobilizing transposase RayT